MLEALLADPRVDATVDSMAVFRMAAQARHAAALDCLMDDVRVWRQLRYGGQHSLLAPLVEHRLFTDAPRASIFHELLQDRHLASNVPARMYTAHAAQVMMSRAGSARGAWARRRAGVLAWVDAHTAVTSCEWCGHCQQRQLRVRIGRPSAHEIMVPQAAGAVQAHRHDESGCRQCAAVAQHVAAACACALLVRELSSTMMHGLNS